LVVADDYELFEFFLGEVRAQRIEVPVQMEFRYSPCNPDPQQMLAAGVKEIDLRNEMTIEQAISEYDLILSLHCLQIFPVRLVENVCCINVHPGFNPYNRGMRSYAFSITSGFPAGATIHLMDAEIDHGDIIAQQRIDISVADTALEVMAKIKEAEQALVRKHLGSIVRGDYQASSPSIHGNVNRLRDYQALCRLNLAHVGTLQEHIDLLRATTYGSRKEAYFHDERGNKYFVGVSVEHDTSGSGPVR
jgi:methionyl-tRNA formyltransferase